MISITYFCRDNSSSGSDSSMQASLRKSKRAEGEGRLSSARNRSLLVPIPWVGVQYSLSFLGRPRDTNGQKGQGKCTEDFLWVVGFSTFGCMWLGTRIDLKCFETWKVVTCGFYLEFCTVGFIVLHSYGSLVWIECFGKNWMEKTRKSRTSLWHSQQLRKGKETGKGFWGWWFGEQKQN